jgi:hypothetical protein
MNKFKTIFSNAMYAFAFIILIQFSANAQGTKRVVIEDFTGTWCQWCPGGIQNIEDLIKIYGDKIIPIAIHNADPMAINPFEAQLRGPFGINGFPAGMIDRLLVNVGGENSFNIPWNPYDGKGGSWGTVAAQSFAAPVLADVDVIYKLDKATRKFTVLVKAKILRDINGQTAFNVALIENDVTGPPTDNRWKQVNTFSNNPSYSTHPFYSKPQRVEMDYDDVLRSYLGGVLGVSAGLPSSMKAGEEYTSVFVGTLPINHTDNSVNPSKSWPINLDKIKVVGTFGYQNAQSVSYINANWGVEGEISAEVTSDGTPNFAVVASNSNLDKTWICKNNGTTEQTFDISVKMSERSPSDWKAVAEQPSVKVAGGASANCKITITPGSTIGIGDAIVTIKGANGFAQSFNVTIMSKETPRFEILADGANVANYVAGKVNNFPMVQLNINDALASYQQLTSLKTVVISSGSAGQLGKNESDIATYLLSKKVNLFINGAIAVPTLASVANSTLLSSLGINWTKAGNELAQINSPQIPFGLKGIANDPITNDLNIPNAALSQNYVPQAIAITNVSVAKPMVNLISSLYPNNPIMAVRGEVSGSRFAVFSMNLATLPGTINEDFLNKTMMWLENVEAAPEPIVITNRSTINYGTIPVGTSKTETVTVTNDGKAKLTLSGASFAFDGEAGYTLGENSKFPIVLDPGQSTDLAVKFAPKNTDEATDNLQIETNDKKRPQVSISLSGKGTATSVRDGVEGVFSVNLTNNPIIAGTKLNYTIGGNTNTNVSIQLVDASGAVVANLVNSAQGPGAYSVDLNNDNLAAGTYFIIARANGITAKLNAVVSK